MRDNTCHFHDDEANPFCRTPADHHLLKYHDPTSEYYIGTSCVNCIGSLLEQRLWDSLSQDIRGYTK